MEVNAPIDSNILYGKIKSCKAASEHTFVCLMENYMLWFDLNQESNEDLAKNVVAHPIQTDYEKVN